MQEAQALLEHNQHFLSDLSQKYLEADTSFAGIPVHQQPILKNLRSKKIIYSLHGFLGTPFEMAYIDDAFVNNGFAIYHDVIPGFSATAKVANSFTWQQWVTDLEIKLKLLAENYQEIYLLGFSTGGLLIHNYLLENSHRSEVLEKIKSIVMYSPFYQPFFGFGSNISKLVTKFFTEVPIKSLYAATRIADLRVMLLQPQNYLPKVPLKTARQIDALGKKVQQQDNRFKMNIPVLCFLSEADRVANVAVSERVMRRDFANIKFCHFSKSKVPHHLMVPEVNEKFNDVKAEVLRFLRLHE